MRTLDLIKGLSDTERKSVEKLLTGGKRETLCRLFKELSKYVSKTEEPTHESLFKTLLNEAYTKDKDYLLRNRMRQLNEIIYEYLATDAFKNTISANPPAYNYWLAKSYYDRRLNFLFESDIESFVSGAKEVIAKSETTAPSYSLNLFSLQSLWMINNQPRLPENTRDQLALTYEWMKEEKRRFLYRVREIEARQAFLKRQLGSMKNLTDEAEGDVQESLSIVDLREAERGDWFARYLTLKREVFQTKGRQRIMVLEEMLQIGAVPEHLAVLGPNDQITNMTNLATELILLGEYQEADDYLVKLLTRCREINHPVPIAGVQNHITNQINLGRYEKGIQIYKQYSKAIAESRSTKIIALHLSYLYLFLGKEDAAISHLPEPASLVKHLQVHHRYAYLISFIMRGDRELALTEAANLKRGIKKIDRGNLDEHLMIIHLFEEYIKATGSRQTEKVQKIKTLRRKMEIHFKKWNILASVELPLRWLMVQLSGS